MPLHLLFLPQEFQPSGAHGKSVKMGDYVRDLLLEQVCNVRHSTVLGSAVQYHTVQYSTDWLLV